jgi:hypothetical protein
MTLKTLRVLYISLRMTLKTLRVLLRTLRMTSKTLRVHFRTPRMTLKPLRQQKSPGAQNIWDGGSNKMIEPTEKTTKSTSA